MENVRSIAVEMGVKPELVRAGAKAAGFTLKRGKAGNEFNAKDASKIKTAVKKLVTESKDQ
jgi:hypothetical protein